MSVATTSARFGELAAIVGDKHVNEAAPALSEFRIDGVTPAMAVTPGWKFSAVLSANDLKPKTVRFLRRMSGVNKAQKRAGVWRRRRKFLSECVARS